MKAAWRLETAYRGKISERSVVAIADSTVAERALRFRMKLAPPVAKALFKVSTLETGQNLELVSGISP